MDINTICGIMSIEQMFLEIERRIAVIAYRIEMMEANLAESESVGDEITGHDYVQNYKDGQHSGNGRTDRGLS